MELQRERVPIINTLRGCAALLVVVHHLFQPNVTTIYPTYLSEATMWWRHGVEVFFVISGFVLPYSLEKSGYVRADFFRFLLKRAVRILPVCYVSLFLL